MHVTYYVVVLIPRFLVKAKFGSTSSVPVLIFYHYEHVEIDSVEFDESVVGPILLFLLLLKEFFELVLISFRCTFSRSGSLSVPSLNLILKST